MPVAILIGPVTALVTIALARLGGSSSTKPLPIYTEREVFGPPPKAPAVPPPPPKLDPVQAKPSLPTAPLPQRELPLPPLEPEPEVNEAPPPTPAAPPADEAEEELPTPPVQQAPIPAPPPVISPEPAKPAELPPAPVVEDIAPEPEPEKPIVPPPAPAVPPPDVKSPVPTPPVQTPATSPRTPAGFDLALARELAPKLQANLKARGKFDYDRTLARKFQTAAGIPSDGIYGGETRGALLAFGVANPQPASFPPTETVPYKWAELIAVTPSAAPVVVAPEPAAAPPAVDVGPTDDEEPEPAAATPPKSSAGTPPAGFNPTTARKLAKPVASNIDSKGKLYSQKQLKEFQRAAGLVDDGLYGGSSRGALIHYGVARPPQPLFAPVATKPYQWADLDQGAP